MNIAIDGFSSTGKSSISKKIAQILGITHLDTGAMFRFITYFAIQHCLEENQLDSSKLINSLSKIRFDYKIQDNQFVFYYEGKNIEEVIRNPEIGKWVSQVATLPEVRKFLLNSQRDIAKNNNVIMDGRDIGTVVLPNADYKFFLTASIEERARRRYLELKSTSKHQVKLEEVAENLKNRDYIDSTREIAPLKPATDAIIIDNTYLNKEESIQKILEYLQAKT